MFAGTGALAIEALSRGARFGLLVDNGSEARALLRGNVEALALGGVTRIWRADATKLGSAPKGRGPFALAFLDPPYGEGLAGPALASLVGEDGLSQMRFAWSRKPRGRGRRARWPRAHRRADFTATRRSRSFMRAPQRRFDLSPALSTILLAATSSVITARQLPGIKSEKNRRFGDCHCRAGASPAVSRSKPTRSRNNR